MKKMTETKRVGGRGIYMRPTWTSDMQSSRRRVVMQHTDRQSTRYITHVYIQALTIRMNNDKNTMPKDDQENIWPREATCQAEWYTVVSVCMWSDQNDQAKIRINTLSNAIRSIINNPACQNLKWIWHLSMHQEILNVQSRDEHPLIVQSNAAFASL